VTGFFSLDGKRALVTGANTGIGRAIAEAMAGAGAEVLCAGRSSAAETVAAIDAAGGRASVVHMDLAVPKDGVAALEAAGALDILVNNAGIIRREDAIDFTEQDWDDVIDINLKSVFLLSQAFARAARRRDAGGAIVNIASLLSFQGGIRVPSYTASKHGVVGLTKALANEWAKFGINVNAIAPGYISTNNTQALRDDEKRSTEILGRIPAGRWGDPRDIAGTAVFLASPAAAYIHGSVINVDGGWLAR
jgi:2-deoxy-D-gluconate 3-dehydrogenase